MNVYFIFRLRLLTFFPIFAFVLADTSLSTSQEILTVAFEDSTTPNRFLAKAKNWQQIQDYESLSNLLKLHESVRPFRQSLLESIDRKQVSMVGPIWGGLLGATVGLFGGAFLGSASFGQRGYDAVGGAIVGAIIGEVLVMPLGVHYGNNRQGKFGLDLLSSAAVAGAGLLMMNTLSADESFLLLLPVLQIGATVAVERATAHSR